MKKSNYNHVCQKLLCWLLILSVTLTAFTCGPYKATDRPAYAVTNIVSTSTAKYTYNQMVKDLSELHKAYPSLMSYQSLGTTYDDRKIYEIQLGNKNAKKHIFIQASIHAREYMNTMLAMRQAEMLCRNYSTASYNGKSYKTLLKSVCLHIVPMANPDGVSISQFGADGIRNNTLRSNVIAMCKKYGNGRDTYYINWKANARGVDLNANYPKNWHTIARNPCSANYSGSKAGSEKETQILMNRIARLKPDLFIAYHSTGNIVYWNFLQNGTLQTRCRSLFNMFHRLTGYADAEPGVNKNNSSLKPVFGDWAVDTYKKPCLTIENGSVACPLPLSQFNAIWNHNKNLLPALMVFTLTPTKTSIKYTKTGKTTLKVKWGERVGSGYQIQYSTSRSMKNSKKVTVKNSKKLSKTIKGLKRKKTYYIRVRAYRKVNGHCYYSRWSTIKKRKTK